MPEIARTRNNNGTAPHAYHSVRREKQTCVAKPLLNRAQKLAPRLFDPNGDAHLLVEVAMTSHTNIE
eukprot:scaffold255906_cov31-Tisochrysis_lutea.AAC.2